MNAPKRAKSSLNFIASLTLIQFGLGIATLLLNVPVWLGALHQLNAALLLTASVALIRFTQRTAR